MIKVMVGDIVTFNTKIYLVISINAPQGKATLKNKNKVEVIGINKLEIKERNQIGWF